VVGLLCSLRLRVLGNTLRGSAGRLVGFILVCVVAVGVAFGGFAVLVHARGHDYALDEAMAAFTLSSLLWLVSPLLGVGSDGVLDPVLLQTYPVRTRPLAAGLLVSSLIGPWPAASVVVFCGAVAALASGAAGIAVGVLAAVVQLAFCVTLSIAFSGLLAGLLRRRKGKDLAVMAMVLVVPLTQVAVHAVELIALNHRTAATGLTDRILRWTPPGAAAQAISDASDGHPAAALARLGAVALLTAALGLVWVRTLDRALTTVDQTTQGTKSRRGRGLPLGRIPGAGAAVTARSWLYQRREPAYAASWLGVLVLPLLMLFNHGGPGLGFALAALSGFIPAIVAVQTTSNLFGATGPALWFDAMTLGDRRQLRAYVAGHNASIATVAIPVLSAFTIVISVVGGAASDASVAVPALIAGICVGLGLADIVAVFSPYPVSRRLGTVNGRAVSGYSGHAMAGGCGTMFGTVILSIPILVTVIATRHVALVTHYAVLWGGCLVYGIGLLRAGQAISTRAAVKRLPHLVELAAQTH